MHAVATAGKTAFGITLHSVSGVKLSFLNFLNQPLGSISLVNATNPGSLGSNSIAIDSVQHNYTAKMSDLSVSAGLNASDPIQKISLEFFALADYSFGGNIYPNGYSSAKVWLDNIAINPVPVPSAVWFFGSGFLGLTTVARRKKA